MKFPLEISTPPVSEPVTLSELKDFFREDRAIEDVLIKQFGKAARSVVERYTGYTLVETGYKMFLPGFVDVKIPKKPVKSSSVSVDYKDENGTLQALSSNNIDVHEMNDPVEVVFSGDLPKTDSSKFPVTINFIAGYATAGLVPDDWKTAIGLIAMTYWQRDIPMRELDNINPMEIGLVRSLLRHHKFSRFK